MKFHKVPCVPVDLEKTATDMQISKHMGTTLLRQEILDRCGRGRSERKGTTLRICEGHDYEWITKIKTMMHDTETKDGKVETVKYTQNFKLYVPRAEGMKSTNYIETKRLKTGLGIYRIVTG